MKKENKTTTEYALGKKEYSTIVLTITMIATICGGGSVVGSVTEVYSSGILILLTRILIPISYCILSYFIVHKFEKYHGYRTVGEIIAEMYGNKPRIASGFISYFWCIGVLAAQIKGLSWVVENMVASHSTLLTLLIFGIIAFYTSFGGVSSVIRADIFHFTIFMTIIPIVTVQILNGYGGFESIINNIPQEKIIELKETSIISFLSLGLFYLVPCSDPLLVHRLLIGKNVRKNKSTVNALAFIYVLDLFYVCTLALIAMSKFPSIEPKSVVFHVVKDFFNNSIVYIAFCVAIIAVIASTIDSVINTSTLLINYDLLRNLSKKFTILKFLKLSSIVTCILALVFSYKMNTMLQIVWFFGQAYYSSLFVPFILGLFIKHKTSGMFWGGYLSGLLTFIILKHQATNLSHIIFLFSMLASFIGYMVVFLIYKKKTSIYFIKVKLQYFYTKILQTLSENNMPVEKLGFAIIPLILIKAAFYNSSMLLAEYIASIAGFTFLFINKLPQKYVRLKNLYILFCIWYSFPFLSMYLYYYGHNPSMFSAHMIISFVILIVIFKWRLLLFYFISSWLLSSILFAYVSKELPKDFGALFLTLSAVVVYINAIIYLISRENNEIKSQINAESNLRGKLFESEKKSLIAKEKINKILSQDDINLINLIELKTNINELFLTSLILNKINLNFKFEKLTNIALPLTKSEFYSIIIFFLEIYIKDITDIECNIVLSQKKESYVILFDLSKKYIAFSKLVKYRGGYPEFIKKIIFKYNIEIADSNIKNLMISIPIKTNVIKLSKNKNNL